VVLDDLDLLLLRVLQLPRRRLEVLPAAPRHHLHVRRAEPLRRAAAVHGRVADADDQHARLDLRDVAEVHGLQEIDADVDAVAVVPARDVQVLAARRAAADEDGVVTLAQQRSMLSTGVLQRRSTPMSRM
jgi:hypothetical protein